MRETIIKTFTDKVGNEVVSSLILYTVDLPSRYLGVIEEVQTKEEYRNQGRATKLIHEALEFGKELGLDCIELTVRQDNPKVQNLYKSLGFIDRLNHAYRYQIKNR
jgi:ribosomal protein S18 acetylase RimI-like enzyme